MNNKKLLGLAFMGVWLPGVRAAVAMLVRHQEDILYIQSLLPEKYTGEQIEAAMQVSELSPRDLYMAVAANLSVDEVKKWRRYDYDIDVYRLAAGMDRFYEALGKARNRAGDQQGSA